MLSCQKTRRRKKIVINGLIITSLLVLASGALFSAPAPATRPEDVIAFLNQSVVWYRQLAAQRELVDEPNDAVFLEDNRQIADQVVRLSFEYAHVQEQFLSSQPAAGMPSSPQQSASPQYQNLTDAAARADQRINQLQTELEAQKQQLASATGRTRTVLESEIAETESELQLARARKDTIRNMLDFAGSVSSGGATRGGLHSTIEELEHSIPALAKDQKNAADAQNAPTASISVTVPATDQRKAEPSSIVGLITDVLDLKRKLHLLDTSVQLTDSLANSAHDLRSPLVTNLRELTHRADELASQPDSQDPQVLAQQRKEVDGLTIQFKQFAAAILPLSKQNLLLDAYKHNLMNWRNDVGGHYSTELRSLLIRLGILALLLGFILAASEVWRRVTFRLVSDRRRRHQFLLLRRIVVWPLVIIILVVAFANGLGSVTTFAGLTTAGIAVALQNLILSVVGYFVLIGKYGVRVGDRIQVAGVTGDVMDIGIVRFHIVEVSPGPNSKQTGRVVAFSNAVVFQPGGGLFKQIPGTSFIWHEVSLALPPDADYRQVEQTMLEAVNGIFAEYRGKMESQRRSMERAIGAVSAHSLSPESRLRLADSGVQVVIRYPLEMENAAEIDSRITHEILKATGRAPKLQTVEPPLETRRQHPDQTLESSAHSAGSDRD